MILIFRHFAENGFAVNHAEANRFLKRTGVGEADKIEIDEFSLTGSTGVLKPG